jgi:purine-binding chemotaxis protein CheW
VVQQDTAAMRLVVFRLGDERYAVPLSCVRELARVPPITPVPRLPPFVAGVANLRGNILGLIDLRTVVGASPAGPGEDGKRRMLVLHVEGVTAGLLVDAVEDVAAEGELDPPVATLPDFLRPLVRGHLQSGGALITVLEPELIKVLREKVEAESP